MNPPPHRRPRTLPRRRRVFFAASTAALLIVTAELLGWVGIGAISGSWFSPTSLQRLRSERIAGPVVSATDASAPGPRWTATTAIHPFLGYVQDPTAWSEGVSRFGFYEDRDPIYRRSPGRVVVGIFGGSFAWQFRRDGLDSILAGLRESREFAGREFDVTSFALGGYKQPQQLMALNWVLALGGEFDIILNIDGFNEVALHDAENRSHGVFPAYPRSWYFHALGIADGELVERAARLREIRVALVRAARQHSRVPWRWSGLGNLVWVVRDDRNRARMFAAQKRLMEYRVEEDRYVASGPALDQTDDETVDALLVDVWKHGSRQMANLARANDTIYVHALQPNQYVEGSKTLSDKERRLFFNPNHPYRAGVVRNYDRLRTAGGELAAEGVRFVDLTRVYADVSRTIYADDCCHVTEEGYRLLAPPLIEAIVAEARRRRTGYSD